MAESTAAAPAQRILVVDDDRELCELLVAYLQRESFAVECVYDGETGLERAIATPAFDVVILDVMLPGIPGFEVLRRLRAKSTVPVLMLTARGEDVDRIVGLELGADDYLPKPFNPRELVARLHAILRRSAPAAHVESEGQTPLHVQDLAVHLDRREATFEDRVVPLTTVEFDVLCVLVRSVGRVVTREEISKHALGRPYSPYDRSVDMHVMNLRRKFQPIAGERILIKTVRSAGYVLAAGAAIAQGREAAPAPASAATPPSSPAASMAPAKVAGDPRNKRGRRS